MNKAELKVKTTKSYSTFSTLPMNRDVDSAHVQKMIKSIRAMGVIRPVVICETTCIDGVKRKYILDGQHLATALEREGLEIPFTEISVTDEKDIVHKMALLNNSSKSWTLLNYVNAYKMYYPDYMKLFKWKNMYDIEPLMLAQIAYNTCVWNGSLSKIIKQGDFEIKNPKAEEMCKAFNDFFIKLGRADRWIKSKFLSAFIQAYGRYNHTTALANMSKNLPALKAMSDPDYAETFIKKKIFNI